MPSVRHLKEAKNAYDTAHKLHTFSVGLAGSPDLVAARKVASFLGTIHHEFTFTVQEGLDALEDLIWHIESIEQARLPPPYHPFPLSTHTHTYKCCSQHGPHNTVITLLHAI